MPTQLNLFSFDFIVDLKRYPVKTATDNLESSQNGNYNEPKTATNNNCF